MLFVVTPAFIKVALHFHTMGGEHTGAVAQEMIDRLVDLGMLTKGDGGAKYTPTPKLSTWVAALCKVPFPVEKWIVEWPKNHQA